MTAMNRAWVAEVCSSPGPAHAPLPPPEENIVGGSACVSSFQCHQVGCHIVHVVVFHPLEQVFMRLQRVVCDNLCELALTCNGMKLACHVPERNIEVSDRNGNTFHLLTVCQCNGDGDGGLGDAW